MLVAASHSAALAYVPAIVEPIGTIWINAIRLAVIPVVSSSLVIAVGETRDARRLGTLGIRALALVLVFLIVAVLITLAVGLPAMHWVPIDSRTVSEMIARAGSAAAQPPSIAKWFTDLVPVNVVQAAAEGALLPIIVVSIAFGLALTRIEAQRRTAVLQLTRGIYDAFLVIIRAAIALAPVGIFALAVPLAARVGLSAAGALAAFVVLVSGVLVTAIGLMYPVAVILGRIPFSTFVKSCAPAQSITFTSRSSLAALPAAYEGARDGMKLPDEVCDLFIPLGVSMFRVGGAIAICLGVVFLARLYGVPLSTIALGTVAIASVAASLTVPGVPGGSILVMTPVLAAAGVPAEGIGVLLAVDAIPDMFRTTANVTGTMAVAALLGRGSSKERGRRAATTANVSP